MYNIIVPPESLKENQNYIVLNKNNDLPKKLPYYLLAPIVSIFSKISDITTDHTEW